MTPLQCPYAAWVYLASPQESLLAPHQVPSAKMALKTMICWQNEKLHWLKQNFSNTLRTKTLVGGWGKGWWPCPAAALKNHHWR